MTSHYFLCHPLAHPSPVTISYALPDTPPPSLSHYFAREAQDLSKTGQEPPRHLLVPTRASQRERRVRFADGGLTGGGPPEVRRNPGRGIRGSGPDLVPSSRGVWECRPSGGLG